MERGSHLDRSLTLARKEQLFSGQQDHAVDTGLAQAEVMSRMDRFEGLGRGSLSEEGRDTCYRHKPLGSAGG